MQQAGHSTGQHIWIVLLAFLVLCAGVTLTASGDAGTLAIAELESEHLSDVGENVCPDTGLDTPVYQKSPITSPLAPAGYPGFVTASDAYPGCILHGPPVQTLSA